MIRLFKVRMHPSAKIDVGKVLDSGYVGEGPKVKEFELALTKMFEPIYNSNPSYVVATNSATSAEHLAYHIAKDPRYDFYALGDEVLTTALTCTATNWPILANGLKIKWVDIDPLTMNMDLDDLARKITPNTKAIVAVHWGGYPIDMTRLEEICVSAYEQLGVRPTIIQDCAHAIGTTLRGEPISSWGHFSTYSFQAIKHLTCGDGGALVCKHLHDFEQAKLLRWYGIDRDSEGRSDFRCETDIQQWGYKFHMNDISATIGLANLPLLDDTLKRQRNNAAFYDKELQHVSGIQLMKREEGFESSCWLYTIRVRNRSEFMKMMKDKGVEVSRVHNRNDLHTCVEDFRALLPNLDIVSEDMICIPVGWWLTVDDLNKIIDAVKGGW